MTNSKPIRIIIADDHAMVRRGITTWIESEDDLALVGEAVNGKDAVEKALRLKPDVVLMDLIMPELDGISATREIAQKETGIAILIITSFSEKEKAVEAIRSGAMGFILKDTTPEELLEAIRQVSQGKPWLSTELTRLLIQKAQQAQNIEENDLTEREMDVLKLVAQGFADQDIAEKLILSKTTVRYHVTNILSKLQLENRTQAALYAIRKGWVNF